MSVFPFPFPFTGSLTAVCAAALLLSWSTAPASADEVGPAGDGTPQWPSLAIAQREFSGEQMFVESSRDGGYVAWVISIDGTRALDFFSGDVRDVQAEVGEDGRLRASFTDAGGQHHGEGRASGFRFKDPRPGGALPVDSRGDRSRYIDFSGDVIHVGHPGQACAPVLKVVRLADYRNGSELLPAWRKLALYREPPSDACPNGTWQSLLGTALDLGDGSFLATTTTDLVFRLDKSSLLPVGPASGLRVVDAAVVETALADAGTDVNVDPDAYLTSLLAAHGFEGGEREEIP